MPPPLLHVEDLTIQFKGDDATSVVAVNRLSFQLKSGETLALVGESGSGKSVTALALTQLLPPPPKSEVNGNIRYCDLDLTKLKGKALRRIRGKDIAYIFQEPTTALNPSYSIGFQIAETIRLHRPDVTDIKAEVINCLEKVELADAATRHRAYPHELSGGMQQRAMIAMALASQPKVLIADEPTTALDTITQRQIMELLESLQQQTNMALILITHDFGLVRHCADTVCVLQQGVCVEQGSAQTVLNTPQHPYTQMLIDCVPKIHESALDTER